MHWDSTTRRWHAPLLESFLLRRALHDVHHCGELHAVMYVVQIHAPTSADETSYLLLIIQSRRSACKSTNHSQLASCCC